jgi:stalled ribosome rescue protein Dom34
MTHYHACVWLDHREARIFGLSDDDFDEHEIRDRQSPAHIHRKADHVGQGKAGATDAYFAQIAEALRSYRAILIVGPGTARNEFAGYLVEHDAKLRARIWGIEAMDHPTGPELIAAARKYFRAADRMHGS